MQGQNLGLCFTLQQMETVVLAMRLQRLSGWWGCHFSPRPTCLKGSCKARSKYNGRAMEVLGCLQPVVSALLSLTKLPQIHRLKSLKEKPTDWR